MRKGFEMGRRGLVIAAAVFAVATFGMIETADACHHDGAAAKTACGDCGKGGDCACKKGGECAKGGDCACKGGGECAKGGEGACKAGGDCAKADCACKKGGECKCGGDCKCGDAPGTAAKAFDTKPAVGTKAVCPVMGGEFTVSEKTEFSEHGGKFYAFCCPGCKPKFDAEPAKYAAK